MPTYIIMSDGLRNRLIVAILLILIMLLMPLSYSYAENVRIGVLANKGTDDAKLRWTLTAEYLQNKIPSLLLFNCPIKFCAS